MHVELIFRAKYCWKDVSLVSQINTQINIWNIFNVLRRVLLYLVRIPCPVQLYAISG